MSLNDLRDHLHDQAAEIDPTQPVPLAAVRRRRAQLRRRRVAATAAGTAIVAVVAVVALSNGLRIVTDAPPASSPSVRPTEPSDGLPSRAPKTSGKDHVQYGIRYRAEVAGGALQAATVGKVGQASASLRWIPGDRQVDVRVFCSRPIARGEDGRKVVLRIDGRVITTEDCSSFPVTDPGSIVTARLTAKRMFADPTRPAVITAEIVDLNGIPSASPDQQVGIGIYSRSDDRPIFTSPDVSFPAVIEHQGHLYRWADSMTTEFAKSQTQQGVTVQTPAFKPFIVVFGTVDVPELHTFEIAGVSGGQTFTVGPGDGPLAGLKSVAVEAQAAGQVEARPVGDSPSRGSLVIGLYLPAD
ncbi:hypothetical protein EV138_4326 [Kribbella voronezhensis]|uniref:Uncharacterized protein n=1 Tax=Kribbella voronezhensis TaxID=2512212 RepID=A0A4R7TET7_9ACTN|nr:hypothetical protein [Kribbella voronezhensis]TDU90732.1 hypothetical protein EV138_4326 [Kribbella voronezhensis]